MSCGFHSISVIRPTTTGDDTTILESTGRPGRRTGRALVRKHGKRRNEVGWEDDRFLRPCQATFWGLVFGWQVLEKFHLAIRCWDGWRLKVGMEQRPGHSCLGFCVATDTCGANYQPGHIPETMPKESTLPVRQLRQFQRKWQHNFGPDLASSLLPPESPFIPKE